jgi:hypothetical protein
MRDEIVTATTINLLKKRLDSIDSKASSREATELQRSSTTELQWRGYDAGNNQQEVAEAVNRLADTLMRNRESKGSKWTHSWMKESQATDWKPGPFSSKAST